MFSYWNFHTLAECCAPSPQTPFSPSLARVDTALREGLTSRAAFRLSHYAILASLTLLTRNAMKNRLYYGDNLEILRNHFPDASVDLIYLDPPFNSNRNYNVLFKSESGADSEA